MAVIGRVLDIELSIVGRGTYIPSVFSIGLYRSSSAFTRSGSNVVPVIEPDPSDGYSRFPIDPTDWSYDSGDNTYTLNRRVQFGPVINNAWTSISGFALFAESTTPGDGVLISRGPFSGGGIATVDIGEGICIDNKKIFQISSSNDTYFPISFRKKIVDHVFGISAYSAEGLYVGMLDNALNEIGTRVEMPTSFVPIHPTSGTWETGWSDLGEDVPLNTLASNPQNVRVFFSTKSTGLTDFITNSSSTSYAQPCVDGMIYKRTTPYEGSLRPLQTLRFWGGISSF